MFETFVDEWRAKKAAKKIYRAIQSDQRLLDLGIQFVGEDDRVHVTEARGLRAFWVARGGHIEGSAIHTDTLELPQDIVGCHVMDPATKFDWSHIAELAVDRMSNEIIHRVVRVYESAVPSVSQVSPSIADRIDTAIEEVIDASLEDKIVVVGRRRRTGIVSGPNIKFVELRSVKDELERDIFGDTTVVASPEASTWAIFGKPHFSVYREKDTIPNNLHFLVSLNVGGVVHHPERVRRV